MNLYIEKIRQIMTHMSEESHDRKTIWPSYLEVTLINNRPC